MSDQRVEHEGPGHGDVTLSLTWELPDGGRLHESWNVCECTGIVLRNNLGPAQNTSLATAAQTRKVAKYGLKHGGVHNLSGQESGR
jgi:hypothetical protein